MTGFEEAERIINLMRSEIEYLDGTEAHKDMRAKECALICIDTILTHRDTLYYNDNSLEYQYFQAVKKQILNYGTKKSKGIR